MPKGIPKINRFKLRTDLGPFEEVRTNHFHVSHFTLLRHGSIKEFGYDFPGLLVITTGDVVLTVGTSVIELKQDQVADIPPGYMVNIKALAPSAGYLIEVVEVDEGDEMDETETE